MGAINYKSNKYITIGYNIQKAEKEAEEIAAEEETFEENNIYYDLEEETFEEVKEILEKYNFNYIDTKLETGYYQGFYIDFNFDYLYFYNSEEKKEALKEATQLKKLLYRILDYNCVVCYPGWCTSYLNKTESKKEIFAGIKQLKEDIKNTLTEKNYFKIYDIFGNKRKELKNEF